MRASAGLRPSRITLKEQCCSADETTNHSPRTTVLTLEVLERIQLDCKLLKTTLELLDKASIQKVNMSQQNLKLCFKPQGASNRPENILNRESWQEFLQLRRGGKLLFGQLLDCSSLFSVVSKDGLCMAQTWDALKRPLL